MNNCAKCNVFSDGFLMPTHEGVIKNSDDGEGFTLSFICSHCLLKEINKKHSIAKLLDGIKIK